MEHETPVEDLLEVRRAQATAPALKASEYEVSAAEQAALGPAGRSSPALPASVVAGLQRAAGNAAVRTLIQRAVAPTEEEGDPSAAVRDVVGKGRGQPLEPALREEMEGRLGDDFSDVRVHTDAAAARSAAAVSARAYTVGHEIVLGADSPALDSAQFKPTLAHELTHVVQQRHGPVDGTLTSGGISISDPSDRFEQAAAANAARVMSGPPVAAQADGGQELASLLGAGLQRQAPGMDLAEEEESAAEFEEAEREGLEEAELAEVAGGEAGFEQAEAESATEFEEIGAGSYSEFELEGEAEAELAEAGAGGEAGFEQAEAESATEFEEAGAGSYSEFELEGEAEAELAEAGAGGEAGFEQAEAESATEFEESGGGPQAGYQEAEKAAEEEEEEAALR